MYCGVEMKPFVTTPSNLYGIPTWDNPAAGIQYWTGDYYCPKCKAVNCWIPETKDELEKAASWFKNHPQDLDRVIPELRERILEFIEMETT